MEVNISLYTVFHYIQYVMMVLYCNSYHLVLYLHSISHCLTKPAQASSNAPLCMDSISCFLKYSPIISFLKKQNKTILLTRNSFHYKCICFSLFTTKTFLPFTSILFVVGYHTFRFTKQIPV